MNRSAERVLTDPTAVCSRRGFLTSAAAGLTGLTAWGRLDASPSRPIIAPSRAASRLIFINLVGGPSHIDTWDPKPAADSTIRNFDPACSTSVPGLFISENLPRMAQRMHRVSLVRSLNHSGPTTHAAGQQALMTGDCFYNDQATPFFGAILERVLGGIDSCLPCVILGGNLSEQLADGVDGHVQSAAWLAPSVRPEYSGGANSWNREFWSSLAPDVTPDMLRRYGHHDLGYLCLRARRAAEWGTRVVVVNQFLSVFDQVTWDMHANGRRLNSSPADYRNVLCPQLDQALSALLDDLGERGLLAETIVAVSGEMGRSPRINRYGGRDHHTGCWSGLLAGGPIPGGQIVGESDSHGEYPVSNPVTPAEFLATVYGALGVPAASTFIPGPSGEMRPLLDCEPVAELL